MFNYFDTNNFIKLHSSPGFRHNIVNIKGNLGRIVDAIPNARKRFLGEFDRLGVLIYPPDEIGLLAQNIASYARSTADIDYLRPPDELGVLGMIERIAHYVVFN